VEDYFNSDIRLNSYLRLLVSKGAKNTLNISAEEALLGKVCFPSFKEQRVISDFLDVLNRDIRNYEIMTSQLSSIKQTLLDKMFVI